MMRKTRGFVNRWLFPLVTVVLSFSQAGVGLCADDSLFSEARRERGTVRWYTALNVNGSKPLADAFEKKYFDKVYYSHEVGFRKPMVGIYQHVIDDAILTPELSLFMDDKKENVAAAKRLGFKGYEVKAEKDIAEYLKVEGFY